MSRTKQPTELLVSKKIAKVRLKEQVEKGRHLRQTQVDSFEQLIDFRKEHYKWTSANIDVLLGIFSTEEMANEYASLSRFESNRASVATLAEQSNDLIQYIDALILQVESIIECLEIIPISSDTVSTDDR